MTDENYVYASDDGGIDAWHRRLTSRIGDGTGDVEEDFLSCLKVVAACKSGGNFFDIGSGFGRIVGIIRPFARRTVGIEPDAQRCAYTHGLFAGDDGVRMHNWTTRQWRDAFAAERFDVVTFSMVLQHVSTGMAREILADMRALLKPDGIGVVATTHCREERFKTEKNTTPKTAAEFDRYAEDWTGHEWGLPVRLFSRASFESVLAESGLEIVTWRQFCYARPEMSETYASATNVPVDWLRDHAVSQYAVVRRDDAGK
jgi:SAM-dependent methyltransferase